MAIVKVDRPDNSISLTVLDSRAARNRVFSRILGYSRLQPQKPGFFDFVAPTTQKGFSSDFTLILVDKLQVKVYGEFASCKARSLQNVENCIVFFVSAASFSVADGRSTHLGRSAKP
ncbi:MAG: hypothetical protein ICV61_04305 [Microcoleus sp. Co-bin12]|nr:hypothetical protein [Microcoleus sp. Co-bin12]